MSLNGRAWWVARQREPSVLATKEAFALQDEVNDHLFERLASQNIPLTDLTNGECLDWGVEQFSEGGSIIISEVPSGLCDGADTAKRTHRTPPRNLSTVPDTYGD
jgi:hypothetical protein